ncbi:MAG: murein biosynthesis integral membrane protein MurJ [Rickettsiales bacterium]|jgi:putative peptidoglycan lipid II flippase|nr:murein biosynthesis integral membrane protein MurJ [Rickettsiales bacterium]
MSSIIIAMSTLLSRLFGLLRDICFAKYIGTGSASDIFFVAYRIPNFFRIVFAEGAFSAAFVPILSSYMMDRDKLKTSQFLKNMFSLLFYSVLVFTLLAELLMPQIMALFASGFSGNSEKYRLAVALARITFPYLIFISLASFMAGILHAHERFFMVAINPLLLNLIFIISSLLSSVFSWDILTVLSVAVLAGGALQFISLYLAVLGRNILIYPTKIKLDQMTGKFVRNFSSALLSSGVDQLNSIVSSIILSRTVGAISHVYYADRIIQLPISLIGTALGVGILPLLSKKIKQNADDIFEIQENALLVALFLGLPLMICLYKMSYLFVPILFERGEFSRVSSLAVVRCIKIYAYALPPFILSKILQSLFFSMGDTKTPMISALLSLVSNVTVAPILAKYFGYEGVIVSSVLAAYLDFASLLIILLAKKRLVLSEKFLPNVAKIFYALIFMSLTLGACDKFIPLGQFIAPGFMKLFLAGVLSASVYMGISYITGILNPKKYAPTGP